MLISSKDSEINIKFPEKKFNSFVTEIGIKDDKDMTKEQLRKILILSIESFLNGSFSTDQLSSICSKFWDQSLKVGEELHDIFDAGSELAFYIRHPKSLSTFNSFLIDLINFYESETEKPN